MNPVESKISQACDNILDALTEVSQKQRPYLYERLCILNNDLCELRRMISESGERDVPEKIWGNKLY